MNAAFKNMLLIGKLTVEKQFLYQHMQELFHQMYTERNYTETKRLGHKLLSVAPDNYEVRGKLRNCYAETNEPETALQLQMAGITAPELANINGTVARIEGVLSKGEPVASRIINAQESSHVCAVEHELSSGKIFLTKVLLADKGTREKIFYQKLTVKAPSLQLMTPRVISVMKDGETGFIYVTQEKALGNTLHEDYSRRRVIKSIAAAHHLKEAAGSRLDPHLPRQTFQDLGRELRRFYFLQQLPLTLFDSIDRVFTNKLLFQRISRYLEKHRYGNETKEYFHQLEMLILEKETYKTFSRKDHFSFIHGAYYGENIFIHGDISLKINGWTNYRTAPKVMDAVTLLSRAGLSFREIEEVYLDKREFGSYLSLPEKKLFLYGLAVYWLNMLDKETFEKEQQEKIAPLIQKLHMLAE